MKNIIQEANAKARDKQAAYVMAQMAKGKSVREIAEALGLTPQRVYQITGPLKKAKRSRA